MKFWLVFNFNIFMTACFSSSKEEDFSSLREVISYPFLPEDYKSPGRGDEDKVVLRSLSAGQNYEILLPREADSYEVSWSMASHKDGEESSLALQETDRELTKGKVVPVEDSLQSLDDQMGLKGSGPSLPPSYTLSMTQLKSLYYQGQYEKALLEVNRLLIFYREEAQLFKMKGTILWKLKHYENAKKAWLKAKDLNPKDGPLLRRLKELEENKNLLITNS